jgi:hypothetical protein
MQRDSAVATIALSAATDLDEATSVLGLVPALSDDVRLQLAGRLNELYPDPADQKLWQAPTPDRLTDTHLLDPARRAPSPSQWCAELARLCGTTEELVARRTVTVLHRCPSTPGAQRDAQAGVGALIRGFPQAYVPIVSVIDPAGFTDELPATMRTAHR